MENLHCDNCGGYPCECEQLEAAAKELALDEEICILCGRPLIFQDDCECNAEPEQQIEYGDYNTRIVDLNENDEDLPF